MKYLLLTYTLFFVCSCAEKALPTNDSIVLIFDNYFPRFYKTPGGMSNINAYGFFYVDSLNRMISYFPENKKDTLILKPETNYTEVGVSYRNFEEVYFYLHRGDTVTLSLDSLDYPVVTSKNSSMNTGIYNLNRTIRQGKTHHNMEPHVWLGDDIFLTIIRKIDIFRSLNATVVKDYCPLDTLMDKFANYASSYRNFYSQYHDKGKITTEEYERALFWLKLKELKIEQKTCKDKEAFYRTMKDGLSDSLITLPSYHRYLHHFFMTAVDRKGVYIRGKTGSHADYRLNFDSIAEDSTIPPLSKNILLKYCMQGLGKYFSGKDINIYLAKYLKHTNDSILFNALTEKYNLSADANELQLQNLSGMSSTLNELLDRHCGKLLYIDFWASWCAPCKAELPYSLRLQEKYKGKDIVFVYLAWNDTAEKWRNISQKMGLDGRNVENYLITNSKMSSFISDLSITDVPRYMLYGKNGDIINANAPRPSSEEIITLINSNL